MEEEEETRAQSLPSNWSEAVEDLVTSGDTEGAISLLEAVVSKLETSSPSQMTDRQISSAFGDLAKLYSSKDFSLKADDLLSRASLLELRALSSPRPADVNEKGQNELNGTLVSKPQAADGSVEKSSQLVGEASESNGSYDDEWEAIADRLPDELLSSGSLPSVSNVTLGKKTEVQTCKRRGRGTFSYKKNELYSDRMSDVTVDDQVDNEPEIGSGLQINDARHSIHGTQHVLVLADFPPSTRTIDLEKLFEDFRNRGFAIRWVNDKTALAVFRTPSIALEAYNQIQFPFSVRILDEGDALVGSISSRDLEPPRQRPQTSTRTAQRLITQGMGFKLSNTTFSSRELKIQEEARKNRIITRQKMIEDAWGDD